MGTYVLLMKLTDKGAQDIRNAPRWIEETISEFEAQGGKLIGFYPVMGKYDYVALGDMPGDREILTFLLQLSSRGQVRTTTLKAFSTDAFNGVVRTIP